MRIVGGKFKGRFFQPPKVMPARPTTEMAKEGLFNMLQNLIDFENSIYLDLFGGTGSISYEMASRGCTNITCIELDPKLVSFISNNFKLLNLPAECVVQKNDVFRFMAATTQKYDFIFAGPPYPLPNLNTIPDVLFSHNILAEDGYFVLEHNPDHNFDNHKHFVKKRNYGTTIFSFFNNEIANQ